jgi:hypothetical protein
VIAEYGLPARVRPTSARIVYWTAQLLLPVTVLATGVLLQAPRFSLTTPSLIDEWFAVAYSGSGLHALVHGHYLAAGSDFQGRYRPGYTAIWNYAQWHLFGGPSLAMAAVWGTLRIAAFFLAVCLLASWLAYRNLPLRRPLVLLAPMAVVFTPQIAVALTRYGPGEPMMVAGVVIGLTLVGTGARRLLSRDTPRGERIVGTASLAVGYPIYLLGVYSKESAVALLAFVPFSFMWLRPWLKRAARRATVCVGVLGLFLVAPLLHLGIRLATAVLRNQSPWPNAHLTTGQKIFAAAISPFLGVPGVLGTWIWFIACQVAIVGTIIAARRKERDAWLLAGVLVTGFLMSAIPLARGPMPTWYYIPWIVAVAAVSFRAVAKADRTVVLLVIALVTLLVPYGTPGALADWTRTQRSGAEAINLSRSVVAAGCPLYLANFDIEQRVAVPLLFRFGQTSSVSRCSPGTRTAYAVSWKNKQLAPDFAMRCRSGWQRLPATNRIGFYRCTSLEAAPTLDQYQASGEPTVTVVRIRSRRPDPPPAHIFQPLPQPKA